MDLHNRILLVELIFFLNFCENFSQKILFFAYLSIPFLISDCNLEMFYYTAPAKVTRDEARRAANDEQQLQVRRQLQELRNALRVDRLRRPEGVQERLRWLKMAPRGAQMAQYCLQDRSR